ncbi:hypothetical protein J3458_022044 [Metarhizium acridum]|uniref:uncharacterized protein n=1 Tax=Metarhizium acridum TaxID=92637 RepID=UPI001C6C38AD|nr:hypothetical protein J3458_022044 [Metarhizium acridum]
MLCYLGYPSPTIQVPSVFFFSSFLYHDIPSVSYFFLTRRPQRASIICFLISRCDVFELKEVVTSVDRGLGLAPCELAVDEWKFMKSAPEANVQSLNYITDIIARAALDQRQCTMTGKHFLTLSGVKNTKAFFYT